MPANDFAPMLVIAGASAVVVASFYFYCKRRVKRATRPEGQTSTGRATNTVELDYPEYNNHRDSSALLVQSPTNDMLSNRYRDPLLSLRAPPRRAHPIELANHRDEVVAAGMTTTTAPVTIIPATVTTTNPSQERPRSPVPLQPGSSEDPLNLGVNALRPGTPRSRIVVSPALTAVATAAASGSLKVPVEVTIAGPSRIPVAELTDHSGKEEHTVRTVQHVPDVRKPDTALLASAPTPILVSSLSSAAAGTAFRAYARVGEHPAKNKGTQGGRGGEEEEENQIRTQPLDQLPRPIGSYRSPRMPAAMLDPSVVGSHYDHHHPLYRPSSPTVMPQQQEAYQSPPRFSPTILPATIVTLSHSAPSAAMHRPNNRVYNNDNDSDKNNNNNNNNSNKNTSNGSNNNGNNAGQQDKQTDAPRRGVLERSTTGTTMNSATPTTPSFSPDSPLPYPPLPSPTHLITAPTTPPPTHPISPPTSVASPPRRQRPTMGQALPMTTAFGTAGGVPTTNESAAATKEQSMPTISAAGAIAASAASVAATCGSVLSKDGYRSSTSTTCSSSQDDTTTLNGSECGSVYSATPPRKRTLQNASGKGTRFSAFNYVQ